MTAVFIHREPILKKADRMRAIAGTLVTKLESRVVVEPSPPFDSDKVQADLWSDQREIAAHLRRKYRI